MQEYLNFAISHWELSFALTITLLMLGWNIFGYKIQGYTPVTPAQAVAILNKEATVIDVREDKELLQTGKITDTIHIPLRDISKAETTQLSSDLNKPILVVCRSGSRSAIACSKIKKLGFTQVYNLKGGINSWNKSGFPLTKA